MYKYIHTYIYEKSPIFTKSIYELTLDTFLCVIKEKILNSILVQDLWVYI